MVIKKNCLLLLALSFNIVLSKSNSKNSRLMKDPLSRTRCDLVCIDVSKDSRNDCRTQCKSQELKPGACPTLERSRWASACIEECNADSQCDATQRCCKQGCSSTCSEPVDLLNLPGLPALPILSEPVEKRKSVIVRWSDGVGDLARAVPGRVLYLLEEQHHLGPKYEEPRLGEWNLLMRTNKTKVSLRNILKPGRWYRFRVAAVSSAGTRGYSTPSVPFTPRKGPRPPPAPKRLKVQPLNSDNSTVSVRLEWKEPKSDLPIVRYKVYWSRRVRGLNGELDSVLVNHQTISKDQTHYDISNLQPNSMYFLQVQTISQFGLGKLRSDKASVFYNTTVSDTAQPLQKRVRKIKGLKLQKLLFLNHNIRARVSWRPLQTFDGKPRRYIVRWETVKCNNKQLRSKKQLSATTEQTSFDIYELEFNCSYKVNVNRSASNSKLSTDSEILVHIPDCSHFKQTNGTKLNCES